MTSIFVSGGAVIGCSCVIFQQVTIGSNTMPDSTGGRGPTIGDSGRIGAGAKVVGNLRIDDNVRIGASTVVQEDVPDNSVVVSAAQRTITKELPLDNRFYSLHGRWVYYDDSKWEPVIDEAFLAKLRQLES